MRHMQKRTVTVFGGSGFIGRHVVQRLATAGATVRVAVRNPDKALFLKAMGQMGQITPVRVNITDEQSVTKAIAGADSVVNLVGILFERGKQRFHDLHVTGAGIIARVAATQMVQQLVHISAIGSSPIASAHYASTKGKGEIQVRRHFKDAVIIRPSVVFGEEDKFFNRFACVAKYSPMLPLFGGGHSKFQPVYVGDVAEAIVKILQSEPSTFAGQTFELGGPKVYSFKELMEFILSTTRRRRLLVSMPYSFATASGMFLQFLPDPLITPDQVKLLQQDNVVAPKAPSFKALGIEPTAVEVIVPGYLQRYRYYG